jgi:hypothetical protein
MAKVKAWAADLTKPHFGFDIVQGRCGSIKLRPTGGPHGIPAVTMSVNDTDPSAPPGNPPCGWGINRQNPAASLIHFPNGGLHEGNRAWFGFSLLVPPGLPNIDAALGRSLQVTEWYGAPFGGPAPTAIAIDYHDGQNNLFWSGVLINGDHAWRLPLGPVYGQWLRIVVWIEFSEHPTKGSVALWVNGQRQVFTDGSARLHYHTISTTDATGPIGWWLQNYRIKGTIPGAISLSFADPKVGPTLASVA